LRPLPSRKRGATAWRSPSSPRLPRAGAGPAQQDLERLRAARADGADRRGDVVEVEAHVEQLGDEGVGGNVAPGLGGAGLHVVPQRRACFHQKSATPQQIAPEMATAFSDLDRYFFWGVAPPKLPVELEPDSAPHPPLSTATGWLAAEADEHF
jgi:hypothetical protein